ncbi:MAG: hypothetical protein HY996_10845 [Micrococcales bacterium]|nr:hypothetical protein [Micrococcales bacterium]
MTIVRTGGVAGHRRQWVATASGSAADLVRELVESDAWAGVGADPTSRDRFVWSIVVTGVGRRRTLTMPDSHLVGPIQELVRRVQADGEAVADPGWHGTATSE